ncbi:unnamed protein product [Cuscuta campestris]|uniref:Uncharacterized protein n=1 Tax=Cuscuta campestris TaxID=132261 RepID=A0A484KZD6_9ASTE|nr:unnamed protein product [Cuscuta campestris]
MGSESLAGGVRTRASAEEGEVRKLGAVSAGIKRPFDKWTSAVSSKDDYSSVPSWSNVTGNEIYRNDDQQSRIWDKGTSEGHTSGCTNTNLAKIAKVDAELQLTPRKVGRNTAGSSKGLKMLEVNGSVPKTGEVGAIAIELLSNLSNGNNGEKSQMPKLRNNSSGKRGDKRNGKISKGNFSLKNGLLSFSSAAGGHNFLGNLGNYGLKSDALDVAEKLEEMSMEELLEGKFKSHHFTMAKEKNAQSSGESLLHVIRSACSLLQRPERVKSFTDDDKIAEPMHIVSSSAFEADVTSIVSSNDKEALGKTKTVERSADLPLRKPMDILNLFALPPSRDLDALLLDATKSATSRNAPDPRSGKAPASERTGLPPFPWSHGYSGNHKSGPDATKPSTSRTTCQGKWVRVKNISTPQEGYPNFAVDLEPLTYDHSLVPSGTQPSVLPESGNQIKYSSGAQYGEPARSQSQSQVPSEGQPTGLSDKGLASDNGILSSGGQPTCSTSHVSSDEPSPRCLTAARTLCEIATRSGKGRTNETVKCVKKPTQMSARAPKLKLNERPEKPFVAAKSTDMARVCDGMLPPQKPKLMLGAERNEKPVPKNFDRKHWSAPRSVRPPPSKYYKGTTSAEKESQDSRFVDTLYMMEKGFSSRQKPFK